MREQWRRWREWWSTLSDENAEEIERLSPSRTRLYIVLASAVMLYFELLMIRWHATSSHTFAIFKNVTLLSCFLGLGIGFALSRKQRKISLATFLPLLAVQSMIFGLLATTIGGRRVNPVFEHMVMGLDAKDWNVLHMLEGDLFLTGIFTLNATMFIPLGYLTGRLMKRLPAMQAYSLNLIGSVVGVATFFALSLIWAPPTIWMGLGVLMATPFLVGNRRMAIVGVASLSVIILSLGSIGRFEERRYYSPYQLITLRLPKDNSNPPIPTIKVNSAFYQAIHDCSPQQAALYDESRGAAEYYNLPYRVRPDQGDVLVVGAGSGNDVAAALRNGAKSVTAVEIDPAIVYLGTKLHPERPYKDERTNVVIRDARTYLKQTDDRFDTIIYGLLDSHTNMGAMTNVRLDSFVYTLEAFEEAFGRLKDDGMIIVSYQVMDGSQGARLYAMLDEAYPADSPRVIALGNNALQPATSADVIDSGGVTYLAGPGVAKLTTLPDGIQDLTGLFSKEAKTVDMATDDWPFFYMTERTYPVTYAVMVLCLIGISVWMLRRHLGQVDFWKPQSAVFFFLGAGFMLIEAKVITELGLVFGNTWTVSAIAITSVLVMGYLANQWIAVRGPFPMPAMFALLGVSLAAGLGMGSLSTYLVGPLAKLGIPILLTAPLFFAGLIFSSQLAKSGGIADALSANLFGAMIGGFLEYNSMYWGLSSLYPLGLAIYALAFVATFFQGKQTQTGEGETADSHKIGPPESPESYARAA